MTLAIVLMLPYYGWNEGNHTYYAMTRVWQFLVQGAIPCTMITFLSVEVYRKLKLLRASEDFIHSDKALKKSILRANLSMWVALIFVISQSIFWVRLPMDVSYYT